MSLLELKELIVNSDVNEVVEYISANMDELKLLFSSIDVNPVNTNEFKEIISFLHRLDNQDKKKAGIQFLFSSSAVYFKEAGNLPFITTCINNLSDSILKNRLQAWYQYKNYKSKQSHINRFEDYVAKLSKAVSDNNENYIEEVLLDLHRYKTDYAEKNNFTEMFEEPALLARYELLREYKRRKRSLQYRIKLLGNVDKIYNPSDFTEPLFDEKVISFIKNHQDTVWHHILLGFEKYVVRNNIIKYGQANFDSNYKSLTSYEVVKLYCYFNMRKHYYTAMYLFDKCTWINNLVQDSGSIKFIDIGCGPATCGVAFSDYLHVNNLPVKFDYIGIDFYQTMLDEAFNFMDNTVYLKSNKQEYIKNIDLLNKKAIMEDANSLFINTSYLFGSPNLEIEVLAKEINKLLNLHKDLPRFLLFQNTPEPSKNKNYLAFKELLISHETLLSEKTTINYNNQRNSFYTPVKEQVYFEILAF